MALLQLLSGKKVKNLLFMRSEEHHCLICSIASSFVLHGKILFFVLVPFESAGSCEK